MFILKQTDSIPWPVEWLAPRAGGQFDKHAFVAEYRVLPQSRIDQLLARARAAARGELPEEEAARLDQDILDEVFVGWSEIKNPDKTEFEVNAINRAQLLELPGMRGTLVTGYFATLGGGAERKNSKPPRSIG